MHPLLIAGLSAVAFVVAYHTYGRWLGRRVFRLAAGNVVPSHAFADGRDFVPTRKSVVFGHHFTSIAGTGPIVGPAIAVMYGWVPALLWVILGSIFIGAVHDFGSLVVSLRNGGRSVGDVAGDVINRRARLLFLCVLFLCLLIVIAIFGLVIAAVFKAYPAAIFPCLVQGPIALAIGLWLHRRGASLVLPSVIALALMYATTFYGDVGVLHAFNGWAAAWPNWVWIALLLGYGFVASVLPVWVLLQPRDYINSLQLLTALGLIVIGLVVASVIGGAPPVEGADRVTLEMVAPAWNLSPQGAPPIWPFLFITIACGAVSGFHCLVSSGTSSKQLAGEEDARFVGYGAMLTEGFLAVLVILACGAGLGLGLDLGPKTYGTFSWADPDGGGRGSMSGVAGWEAARLHPRVGPIPANPIVRDGHPPAIAGPIEMTDFGGAGGWGAGALPVASEDELRETYGFVISPDRLRAAAVGTSAYATRYQSWSSADGLAAKVGAFVTGAGNLVAAAGVPRAWGAALMAVLVASFALTTLDTAVRLQRYVVEELTSATRHDREGVLSPKAMSGSAPGSGDASADVRTSASPIALPHGRASLRALLATAVAVATGAAMAAVPASGEWSLANVGTGGMILWPLFGATNQLLAGLAFAVILFYLRRRRAVTWFLLLPMAFMLVMPAWATMVQLPGWWQEGRYVLAAVGAACLALETWMVAEAALVYGRVKGVREGDERRGFEVSPVKPADSNPPA